MSICKTFQLSLFQLNIIYIMVVDNSYKWFGTSYDDHQKQTTNK